MVSELFLVVDSEDFLDALVQARELDDSERSVTTTFRLSPQTRARLQIFADALDRTQSSLICQFVNEGLARLEEEFLG